MKIIYQITIYCFCIFSACISIGQEIQFKPWNGQSYGASTEFPENAVAEDFGPRRHSPHNFHRGIDYNSVQDDANGDKGDLILSPENGSIVDVNRLWTSTYSYKQLCIESGDHRYIFGHVYDNDSITQNLNNGTIILKGMLIPNKTKWAQIIIDGIDTIVYGQRIGRVEYNGDTLMTTIDVTQYDGLVPLGDASASGQAHLHLNTIPLNKDYSTGSTTWGSNPLQYLEYTVPPKTLKMYCKKDTGVFKFNYPGDSISSIALRVTMNTQVSGSGSKRYDHIFDIDNVTFYVKNLQTDPSFELIQGPYRKSEIVLGGFLNAEVLNHPNPNFGNWNLTGIDSRAYSSAYPNQPFDIFHYSDWYTLLDKDHIQGEQILTTKCPSRVLYLDGKYEIVPVASTIKGENTTLDDLTQFYILDNFKPFIDSVEVYFGSKLVQRAYWECNDQCNGISFIEDCLDVELSYDDLHAGMHVLAFSSEPLDFLDISVEYIDAMSVQMEEVNNAHMVWETTILFDSISLNTLNFRLDFMGQDMNSNSLLSLSEHTNSFCVTLPTRISDSDFSPTTIESGVDSTHSFFINLCTKNKNQTCPITIRAGDECMDSTVVTVEHSQQGSNPQGNIIVEPAGGFAPYEIEWSNGDSTLAISDLSPGTYCFTLTDALCCAIDSCVEVIDCDLQIDTAEVELYHPTSCNASDGEIGWTHFTDHGGASPYTFIWEDQNGNTPDPCFSWTNAYICDLASGEYFLTLTDVNGCHDSASFVLSFDNEPTLISQTSPACLDADIGYILLFASHPTYHGNYDFYWDSGDTMINVNSVEMENLAAGTYCVSVTPHGYSCFQEECHFIDGLIPDEPLNIILLNNQPSCPDDSTGSLAIDVVGGVSEISGNYSIDWSNGARNEFTVENLSAGTYGVTVTDDCGSEISIYFIIDDYNLTADIDQDGCVDGQYSMEVNTVGDNPPFSYNWNTGSSSQSINNLVEGYYSVTITDAHGCMIVEEHELNPPYTVDTEPSCKGMWEGSATITINNPNGYDTHIDYTISPCEKCPPFPVVNSNLDTIEFTLNGLSPDEDYTIIVNMGPCTYPIHFSVDEISFSRYELAGWEDLGDWQFYCTYNMKCGDQIIENGLTELAHLEMSEVCESVFDCGTANYMCGDSIIASREIESMTLGYFQWLEYIYQVYGATTVQLVQETFEYDPCARVMFCPNDPFCRVSFTSNFLLDFDGYDDLGEGCYRVKCKQLWFFYSNYIVCGLDFLPDYLESYLTYSGNTTEPCTIITKSFAQLVLLLPHLEAEYGWEFINSSLYFELISHMNEPEIWCADISYCANTYEFISSNIDEVECVEYDPCVNGVCLSCAPNGADGYYITYCVQEECESGPECPPVPREIIASPDDFDLNAIFGTIDSNLIRSQTILPEEKDSSHIEYDYEFILYPNPANSKVYVKSSIPIHSQIDLHIYNPLGQKVKSINNFMSSGQNQNGFSVHDWDSGLYYIHLTDKKDIIFLKKLIVHH